MDADQDHLEIGFSAGEASPREIEEMTAAMRRELLQLEVESVERPRAGEPPEGTRGIDVAALGALVVELGKATPVLGQVVEVVRSWVARSPDRSVKLTIGGDTLELTGISEGDQQRVIRDWMARHPRPSVP